MHATLALAALASVASIAQAQKSFQPQSIGTLAAAAAAGLGGYGRFPCTQVNGDGTTQALPSLCTGLQTPAGPGYPSQGGNPAPTGNPQCVEEGTSGAYFCGIAGAFCQSNADCDNGVCNTGISTCQGGFEQGCSVDSDCLGFLYCSSADGTTVGTCGNIGDFCGDPVLTGSAVDAAQYNYLSGLSCTTGFCSLATGNCGEFVTTSGGDCFNEPYICGNGLQPNGLPPSEYVDNTACVCQAAISPSGRARARRNNVHRRNLCPASHTACSIEGSKGFECIDVSSNIEQCGACASAGGVDCSAIEGVSAVGCVAGVCEIWSCEDGYSFDADKAACVAL